MISTAVAVGFGTACAATGEQKKKFEFRLNSDHHNGMSDPSKALIRAIGWKSRLSVLVFGLVTWERNEEYQAFRYRLLVLLLLAGALFTALFIVGNATNVNPLRGWHLWSMSIFTTLSLVFWWFLRGHPERFRRIAWPYEILCLLEYTSALVFVPMDELRILWFYVNIPGVFILLGQRVGWIITLGTVVGLILINPWLHAPYSQNAMATAVLSLLFFGVVFHAYVDRSMSYYLRMRTYNDELQRLASRDPLTGTLNARAYYAACEQLIKLAQRSSKPFAVLFIDLDHFKRINDTYGHAAGDEVLRTVATSLQNSIRTSDLLGRIGGEEFSIFLPDTDQSGAQRLAETLRTEVETCCPHAGDTRLTVTASIGVAVSRDAQASLKTIQARADEAMYRAKQAGRNRVTLLA